jgi:hypothetical protein
MGNAVLKDYNIQKEPLVHLTSLLFLSRTHLSHNTTIINHHHHHHRRVPPSQGTSGLCGYWKLFRAQHKKTKEQVRQVKRRGEVKHISSSLASLLLSSLGKLPRCASTFWSGRSCRKNCATTRRFWRA